MAQAALAGGFTDAPRDAAHAFRAIMTAMARPGVILDIEGAAPPEGLSPAAGAVLLTLCDPDTPVWLAPTLLGRRLKSRGWLRFPHRRAGGVTTGPRQRFACRHLGTS